MKLQYGYRVLLPVAAAVTALAFSGEAAARDSMLWRGDASGGGLHSHRTPATGALVFLFLKGDRTMTTTKAAATQGGPESF